MHTIYLDSITHVDLSRAMPGRPALTARVELTARVYVDYKIGYVTATVTVSRDRVEVSCENDALAGQLYPSREVLLAARLFGKLL